MANSCDTTYIVVGERDEVRRLASALESVSDNGYVRLYRLAEHYGIDWENEAIHVRGEIYWWEYDEKAGMLNFDTDTAWGACYELFDHINEKSGGKLSINYREIEPGCGVYYVHDEHGYFPEECIVHSDGDRFRNIYEECFDTIRDAIDYWLEAMEMSRDGRTDEEMLKVIEEYEYEDADEYYYINQFNFV